jgi:hypothetical protein
MTQLNTEVGYSDGRPVVRNLPVAGIPLLRNFDLQYVCDEHHDAARLDCDVLQLLVNSSFPQLSKTELGMHAEGEDSDHCSEVEHRLAEKDWKVTMHVNGGAW